MSRDIALRNPSNSTLWPTIPPRETKTAQPSNHRLACLALSTANYESSPKRTPYSGSQHSAQALRADPTSWFAARKKKVKSGNVPGGRCGAGEARGRPAWRWSRRDMLIRHRILILSVVHEPLREDAAVEALYT